MEIQGNYGESGPSQSIFDMGNGDLMTNIQRTLETQQKQVEFLHQCLLVISQEYHSGTVSEFRKLQPTIFDGTEKPLDAEQWLINTTDLLKAAQVPKEHQVEVVKIRL